MATTAPAPAHTHLESQPISGPPPRYANVVKRVYPYSLRPIVIFCSGIGFIWAIAMGVQCLQDRGQANASSKQNMMGLIQAILYFVLAVLEIVLIAVAVMQNVAFGRTIMVLAPLGVILTLGAQILNLVRHFALKTDLIAQCSANTVGGTYRNDAGGVITITSDQANRLCNAAYNSDTWKVIAWLIVSVILAGIFASLTFAYYRQLLDPSSVRLRRGANQAETYALQPNNYANNPPPPHNAGGGGEQAWMVPPYPGPPANKPPQGYEKSDHQPAAEWASYGPNGSGGDGRDVSSGFGGGDGNERAQDDAWARAEASGPTAHLTNGAGTRRDVDAESGYVVKNTEEDEAWERARTEGVTAHLTGGGSGLGQAGRKT